MRDLFNHIHPLRVISGAAATTDNTAWVGQIIDHKGYDSATYVLQSGSLADADATFTALLQHGDAADLSDAVDVPDDLLLGTEALAGFTFADDNETRKLGYVGHKRYSRLTVTPANNTGNAFVTAICVLGHPHKGPTINPPV